MPMCFVPGCTSRCNSKDLEKRVLFSFPKEENLSLQRKRAIPRHANLVTSMSKVCDLHFEEDALTKTKTTIVDGKEIVAPRTRWALKYGAIPTKFPNCPSYFSKRAVLKRKPVERIEKVIVKKIIVDKTREVTHTDPGTSNYEITQGACEEETCIPDSVSHVPFSTSISEIRLPEVILPGDNWAVIFPPTVENTCYIYEAIVLEGDPIIRKCVIIDTLRKQVEFKVFNQLCAMEEGFPHHFLTIIDLQIVLQKFHSASVCEGTKDEIYHELQFLQIGSGVFSAGLWRCKDCVWVLTAEETRNGYDVCRLCYTFKRSILYHRLKRISNDDLISSSTSHRYMSKEDMEAKLKALHNDKRKI